LFLLSYYINTNTAELFVQYKLSNRVMYSIWHGHFWIFIT